jgi:hypothetical protein
MRALSSGRPTDARADVGPADAIKSVASAITAIRRGVRGRVMADVIAIATGIPMRTIAGR